MRFDILYYEFSTQLVLHIETQMLQSNVYKPF